MNVWIDMDNSPHVPLLLPFARCLEARGYSVLITAREYAETLELLNNENVFFKRIGRHTGGNKIGKVIGLTGRVVKLLLFAKKKNSLLQ